MRISWSSVPGAIYYNIYRNTDGSGPGVGDLIQSGVIGTSFTDNSAPGLYFYWVSAYDGTTESSPTAAAGNPTSINGPCVANLLNSDKDITAKNGKVLVYPGNPPIPNACSSGTDSLPNGTTFMLGDIVSFSLNICNNSNNSEDTASSIVITDTLTNMQMPAAGWDAKYNGNPITPTVSGKPSPNQTLTFTIPGSLAKNTAGVLTFNAQIAVPSGFTGSTSRYQNCFVANYDNGSGNAATPKRCTPLVPFSIGSDIPTIIEIP